MIEIIGFIDDCGVRMRLHKISMHSRTPSCNGVSSESDMLDIMYGVESLCTGTATVLVSTSVNCFKWASLNLECQKTRVN